MNRNWNLTHLISDPGALRNVVCLVACAVEYTSIHLTIDVIFKTIFLSVVVESFLQFAVLHDVIRIDVDCPFLDDLNT